MYIYTYTYIHTHIIYYIYILYIYIYIYTHIHIYIYTYIYVYIYIYTQLNYFPRVIPTLTQFLTHHLEVYIWHRRRRRGRGRTRSLKSCLAGEENRSIQVLRWVRAGPAGVRESVGPLRVLAGPCGVRGDRGVHESVGSVRVRGVRAGPWGPCVLWALIGPIPDERQQHCHSSLSDRIFFFSISVGRLRTCGETQLGLAACDFLFHVNRRAT